MIEIVVIIVIIEIMIEIIIEIIVEIHQINFFEKMHQIFYFLIDRKDFA